MITGMNEMVDRMKAAIIMDEIVDTVKKRTKEVGRIASLIIADAVEEIANKKSITEVNKEINAHIQSLKVCKGKECSSHDNHFLDYLTAVGHIRHNHKGTIEMFGFEINSPEFDKLEEEDPKSFKKIKCDYVKNTINSIEEDCRIKELLIEQLESASK